MIEEHLQIAVFIDFDNISIGVKNSLSRNFEIGVVLEAIKERGEVITKVAYGDWKRADDYSRAMTQHAVQMVQRNVTPRGDKNGADINLALDALEMAFTRNHINAFVIVGGDSDFIALVEKLKQYGKKVFVVGGRAFTSTILQKNCHEFIAYENLFGIQTAGRKTVAGRTQATSTTAPLENALPQVRRALKVLSDREVSPQLGLLKSTLLQLDPTFSERDFGAGTFLEFIQKMANAGFVNLKQVDRSWLVELKEPDVATAPRPSPLAVPAQSRAHHGTTHRAQAPHRQEVSIPMRAEVSTPPLTEVATESSTPPRVEQGTPEVSGPPLAEETVARVAEAIALLRSIFTGAKTGIHWPMYLRSFKQFLRSAEPSFDERVYGFASIYDLVRQAQREGLLRIERNRKGILRIFPGERFPQAAPGKPAEEQEETVAQAGVSAEPEPVQVFTETPAEVPLEISVEAVPPPAEGTVLEPGPESRKPRARRTRASAAAKQGRQKKTGIRKTRTK